MVFAILEAASVVPWLNRIRFQRSFGDFSSLDGSKSGALHLPKALLLVRIVVFEDPAHVPGPEKVPNKRA
jgi:hypothetical protein